MNGSAKYFLLSLVRGVYRFDERLSKLKSKEESQHFIETKLRFIPEQFVEMSCFTCHSLHKPTPNEKLIVDSLTVGTQRFKVSDEDSTLCLACHATHGPFTSIQTAWVARSCCIHRFN